MTYADDSLPPEEPQQPDPNAPADPQPRPETPELARGLAQIALDKRAEDVRILDLRGFSPIADFFVVVTGFNRRQIQTIAWEADHWAKSHQTKKMGMEGYETGWWVLLDYGDVVLHVMHVDARAYYELERKWADAPDLPMEGPVPPPPEIQTGRGAAFAAIPEEAVALPQEYEDLPDLPPPADDDDEAEAEDADESSLDHEAS